MTGICTALALDGGSNPLTVVTLRTVVATLLMLAWLRYAGVRRAGLRFYGPIRARIAGRMRPCPPPVGI